MGKSLIKQVGRFTFYFLLALLMTTSVYAGQTIKIGLLGPMKFLPGRHIWWGGSLAAEEINKAGGITVNGKNYTIEVVKADTNEIFSLPDAVSAMERLITVDKVDFLIGGFNSEPVLAMQEIMADYEKIWLCPGSSHVKPCERLAKNYNKYKYFFRCGPPNTVYAGQIVSHQVMMVVEKIKKTLGVKKPRVALFYENGLWAKANIKNAIEGIPSEAVEIVGKWVISRKASDVTAEMSAIKAAKPHIILNCVSGPAGIPMSKTWGELKMPAILIGANIPGMGLAHWKATNGMCNYEITMQTIGRVEITDKTIPFYDSIVKKYNKTPSYIAVDAYDAVYVIKDAVERAGTLKTNKVITAIEKTDLKGAMGRINFFPKDHKWPHDLLWKAGYVTWVSTQWRDGKINTVWPDGKARLGMAEFEGLRYKGTVDFELPPWMIKYWKAQ